MMMDHDDDDEDDVEVSVEEPERRTDIISLETAVVKWDMAEPFNRLTAREKLYAHYMSKAAWYGSLIIPVQTSPESPIIFSLLHDLFKTNTIEGVNEIAVNYCFFWEEDWRDLLAYTCGIFSNGGNYLGLGDTKFVPGLSMAKLESLLTNEQIRYTAHEFSFRQKWDLVKNRIYDLRRNHKQLGLGDEGVTTYFSPNCTEQDVALVNRFMSAYDTSPVNTRVFKHFPNPSPTFPKKDKKELPALYEIRTASVDGDIGFGYSPHFEFEGTEFIVTRGDYHPQLKDVRYWLGQAREYCANKLQTNMIDEFISSFYTGSVDEHKEGTRHWLKDKDPNIESYIGFVETYRDPDGQRAEFQGFVLISDHILNEKFEKLADNAMKFLSRLPWPAEFEREVFVKPYFTAAEVLSYACSCVFDSINTPNYPDVRKTYGYKNFALQNVYAALYAGSTTPFLSEGDAKIYAEYFVRAHDVQLGLHEILGHGSGNLLMRNDDGSTNFPSELRNPVTGTHIDSMYEAGESYESLFHLFGPSMEECRAECVGLYLSLDDEVLKLFGFEGEDAENIKYVNWLDCVYTATALCLKAYTPETKHWKQPHDQGKFGILRALIDAGEGLISIEEIMDEDEKPDLRLKLDRSKIQTVGKKALGELLLKLQVYKATADVQSAQRLYRKITSVNNNGVYPWLNWREIMLSKEEAQRLCVQPNTVLTANGKDVKLVTYDPTFEGFIQSWLDRFDDSVEDDEDNEDKGQPTLYAQLEFCSKRDKMHFFKLD